MSIEDNSTELKKNISDVSPLRRYGKLLIITLLFFAVILGGVGGYLYANYTSQKSYLTDLSPTIAQTESPMPTPLYEEKSCTGKECLYNSYEKGVVEGFATLKGYYHRYESVDWGGAKTACDSLLVTGGSGKLIDSFKKQIEEGNTINKYDIDKNLLVNIDLEDLDQLSKKKLLSSTAENPVELGVIRVTPIGRGVSTCFSFLDTLYVR